MQSIFQDIDQAISRTRSSTGETHYHAGPGDRWVNGDVNWDVYVLPDLTKMVAMPASPSQVDTVASLWRSNGAAITQSAENLSQSLTALMKFWQGAAAQQAADSVSGSASWITAVAETAANVADQVENAGGALQSAQNTMPGQPTNNFWAGYNSAADGSSAGAAGGPVGAAAGTMVGGMSSMFGAGADQNAQKQQAVQTMQRFEQAAMSIDTSTPQFQAPPSWGPASGTDVNGAPSPITVTTPGTGTVVTSNGAAGTGGLTVPSFADSSVGRWNALTGGGMGGGAGHFGGLGASGRGFGAGGGGGLGLFGGLSGGLAGETDAERRGAASSVGGPSGAAAVSAASREDPAAMVGRPGGAGSGAGGVLEEVDGAGGGAAPMGGGMMGGMGARGGSEGEHKRRIPFEEDPFLTGLKAAPRVIGLNSVDREDTEK